jgi:hypothetical protein
MIPNELVLHEISEYLTLQQIIKLSELDTNHFTLITSRFKLHDNHIREYYDLDINNASWFKTFRNIFDVKKLSRQSLYLILSDMCYKNYPLCDIFIDLIKLCPVINLRILLMLSLEDKHFKMAEYIVNNYDILEDCPSKFYWSYKRGTNKNYTDPILCAIKQKQDHIFDKLLSNNLTIFIPLKFDDDGKILIAASNSAFHTILNYLWRAGDNDNYFAFSYLYNKYSPYFEEYDRFYTHADNYALYLTYQSAVNYNGYNVTKFLLDNNTNGADRAFAFACERGSYDSVKLFIEYHIPQINNHEPFRVACEYGHVDIVKLFIDNKSNDVMITDLDNHALKSALDNGHVDVVKLLLEQEENKQWLVSDLNDLDMDALSRLLE